jgi:pullulanase/glycogen debranching enzyme
MTVWERMKQGGRAALVALATGLLLAACGGGGDGTGSPPPAPPAPAPDVRLSQGNAGFQTVLQALPPQTGTGAGGAEPTTLTIHYQRNDGQYAGWQVHSWGVAQDPGWNAGHNPSGTDSFGAIYSIPLNEGSGNVGYLFHNGDDKDHGGADQSHTLKPGKNEIWRKQGDPVSYSSPPDGGPAAVPDLRSIRVHYKRFDGDYAAWGLHLWPSNGIDMARLPAGVVIDQWNNAAGFERLPGHAVGVGEQVFEIPVLNPKQDSTRTALEFIIHGKAPNENDKDGRDANIRVAYAELTVSNQVGDIWLVQGDPKVYTSAPDLRRVSINDARAFWLNKQLIQWPQNDGSGTVKLYHSASAQLVVVKGETVRGADGSVTLEGFNAAVPAAAAERFKWIGSGARFKLPDSVGHLGSLLKSQLVLVQEDASGRVQNATTAQLPGALDDLYAAAAGVKDLGLSFPSGGTRWKLWAPTAQKVLVFSYPDGSGAADAVFDAVFDPATGIWQADSSGNLSGKTYRYAVEVFVRGVGLVRNLVTDPYSVALSADGKRSGVLSLLAANSKPAGWDSSEIPATVSAAPDMSIYELHVRDFSANDPSVSSTSRGKYAAFAEAGSKGMQHLRALAQAGLTDVHLLPVYDFASVPETGCTTPNPSGGPADETQQDAVRATQASDCFNWGYDPQHYSAPEGSYSSDANDLAKRVVEFRRMVMGLHAAGLRVGMDVVYNHTSSSGQNERSVLDRVVPGYYHRLNANGDIERSTCCENTATEQLMMAKLMSDSVLLWAREYKIASFRFDLMGHQPRSVMEVIKARLKSELGREVQLLGEGWNFGEVADGRRFVQASQLSLNGSGIGTFNDRLRDAVRGSSFGQGNDFVANQGFVNGAWYDPNALGNKDRGSLMWAGDVIKAGLAGSIRSYELTTHWDARQRLDRLGDQTIGYVSEPGEVVNYVENHDNHTLFDLNAFRLPLNTSREDRARVQILAAAINSFSQGVAYFHAGIDTLRSKNLDRNSYDAGDWFNRLDWSYGDNYFGSGAPLKGENEVNYGVIKPLLANPAIKPTAGEIGWTRDAFRDLLRIRASTTLLRLRTAADIQQRLRFHNVGSAQEPTLIVASIDGGGYAGANFAELVYLINVDKQAKQIDIEALKGKSFQLHPVHLAAGAADRRVASGAGYDGASGRFTIPARAAVVFVR